MISKEMMMELLVENAVYQVCVLENYVVKF